MLSLSYLLGPQVRAGLRRRHGEGERGSGGPVGMQSGDREALLVPQFTQAPAASLHRLRRAAPSVLQAAAQASWWALLGVTRHNSFVCIHSRQHMWVYTKSYSDLGGTTVTPRADEETEAQRIPSLAHISVSWPEGGRARMEPRRAVSTTSGPTAAPLSGPRALPEFRLSPHLPKHLNLNSMA